MAYTICFLLALSVLIFFLVYGLVHVSSLQSYFNCDNQLEGSEFGHSFAAATTSLATVLFFFVTLGITNGLYILLSPISFALGTYLFNRFMLPRLKRQRYCVPDDGGITVGKTLGEYIKQRYDSQLVKYVVLSITLLGILSIMLIELYVGVKIFDIFLKPDYEEYALYFIAFVAFIYTGFGGLNAVIKTDKIQFRSMLIVAFLLVAYLWMFYDNSLTTSDYFPKAIGEDGVLSSNWELYLNMIVVNALLIPSLLRNWQLIAATKNGKEIKKGFWNGVFLTVIISILFIVLGLLFFNIFPDAELSMNGILTTMANSGNSILANVLFPLLFASCLMALMSTVDSSLLPVVQSLVVDIMPNKTKTSKKLYLLCILGTLAITLVLYSIVFKRLNFNLTNWLFTIFSLVTISSPAILFGCFGKEEVIRTKSMKIIVSICTIIGLFIALGISFKGNINSRVDYIQLNAPIAIAISSAIIYCFYLIIKRKTILK